MNRDGCYDDDEIMIFGGLIADEVVAGVNIVAGGFLEDHYDEVRNCAADSAEGQIKKWTGPCDVPLPSLLKYRMRTAARNVALRRGYELGYVTILQVLELGLEEEAA